MRKLIWILFFSIWTIGFAQTHYLSREAYTPTFLNPRWFYFSPTFEGNLYQNMELEKDTLINDTLYQILKHTYLETSHSNPYFQATTRNLVRENKSQRKVYRRRNNREELLYDYALSVGDTLSWRNGAAVLVNIDTFIYQNNYLRRFTFCRFLYNTYSVWIEGIGNTTDFFDPISPESEYNYLVCFHQNGKQLYENLQNESWANCDTFWRYIENKNPSLQIQLSLHPNPAEKEVNITYSIPELGEVKFELWNEMGQKLWGKIENPNILEREYKVLWDISEIPTGVYELRLQVKGRSAATKLLKF